MVFRDKAKDGTTRLTGGVILDTYPVGSLYFSIEPTEPSVLFGGFWERIAKGRMIVGVEEEDEDFDTSGLVGGAKTHTLTSAEVPSHSHTMNHNHTGKSRETATDGPQDRWKSAGGTATASDVNTAVNAFNGSTGNSGGGGAHNNMSPYFTCYIWVRTG